MTMTADDKITSLVVKLNKLTSLKQLDWEVQEAPRAILRGTDDHIPIFMTCTYKGKHFGLYEHRYQEYDGEHSRYYWTNRIVLAILDREDRALWETPSQIPALFDLFETVRTRVSNVDDILNELLGDDDDL